MLHLLNMVIIDYFPWCHGYVKLPQLPTGRGYGPTEQLTILLLGFLLGFIQGLYKL